VVIFADGIRTVSVSLAQVVNQARKPFDAGGEAV
jgi:hypothetical protein